ncbi:MAG: hypothetical protein ACLFNV_07080 [Desulfovibrionales bacterium]
MSIIPFSFGGKRGVSFILITALLLLSAPFLSGLSDARVISKSSRATVIRSAKQVTPQSTRLQSGDRIQVGAGGYALLTPNLPTYSIAVADESRLTVISPDEPAFLVEQGLVRFRCTTPIRVTAPWFQVWFKRADLLVYVSHGVSSVYVLSGLALSENGSAKSQLLTPGTRLIATAGLFAKARFSLEALTAMLAPSPTTIGSRAKLGFFGLSGHRDGGGFERESNPSSPSNDSEGQNSADESSGSESGGNGGADTGGDAGSDNGSADPGSGPASGDGGSGGQTGKSGDSGNQGSGIGGNSREGSSNPGNSGRSGKSGGNKGGSGKGGNKSGKGNDRGGGSKGGPGGNDTGSGNKGGPDGKSGGNRDGGKTGGKGDGGNNKGGEGKNGGGRGKGRGN